ncbi:CRISPR-associated endonuclease Cas2 [Absicoccus porci]|uniref:CRISPR-associated endoribonuclease Cas2 n=2 Tax=Absicoccus porci TaxID=2486576 RepID=A0A3N0I320_9FIRM|nr:CRISPR-associated endonuclease Cas2 [Absicoccus porci]
MMNNFRFMRLLIFFDLPVKTKPQIKQYREFIKYLKNDGFIRVQYSVYAKLCINKDCAQTISKRIRLNAPAEGDIRYMIISELQYQHITNINNTHNLDENITTADRTLIIGGLNNEDS